MNLIEKLGLENAKALDGMWQRSSDGFTHGELRAALADHDRTDTCSDIRNHVSPNTKVIEHE